MTALSDVGKIDSGEVAETLYSSSVVGKGCLYCGRVAADMYQLIIVSDAGHEACPTLPHTFRQFSVASLKSIGKILAESSDAKIGPLVIEPIRVDVIDNKAL